MSRARRFVRQVVLVVLCLVQLAAVASAAPRRTGQRTEQSRAVLLERLRGVLALLWSKFGAGIDPGGAPGSGTTTQSSAPCQGEYGAGIDPSGQCSDGR